jgi:hypothetical protein
MAGLRDEVELDVSAALRDIDRLGAALTQTTQKFRRDMAGSLDTLRATPKVDTSSIDRGRKATQGLTQDQQKLKRATDETTAATGKYGRTLQTVAQVRVVQGLIAFFGGRVLVDQITKTTRAFADLQQETARAEQVFEDADSTIIGFGESAVNSIGLARREAIQASNEFGTMFRDAGLSGAAAAAMSTQFVSLAADLSAFANIGVPEALTKLSSGLAGEIEPLRRIGFAIGQTATETKALELGMVKLNGAFTQGQLTQARAAIIIEKLALVNGQFARESEGLIGQQARLRAESEQLREELGEQLAPVMLDLVRAARDNLPAFGELATNVIPLVISALSVLNPSVQVLLQLLTAFSPILTVVASVLNAIPAPVLQMAGAFVLVNKALGPLTRRGGLLDGLGARLLYAQDAIAKLGTRQGIGAALGSINPVAAGATVALVGLTTVLSQHRNEQAKAKAAIEETTAAFLDQADAIRADARATTLKRITDQNQTDDLRDLGLSITEFARLAVSGQRGIDELIGKMEELGGNNGLRVVGDQYRSVAEAVKAYGNVSAAVAAGVIEGNDGLVLSLFRLNNELQGSAKAALDQAVVTERLSAAQADAAIDDATINGVTDWYAALLAVEPALAAAILGAEGLGIAGTETTGALDELDEALSELKDTLDAVFGRFLDAEEATSKLRDATFDLASALGEGRKEGESTLVYQDRLAGLARNAARAIEDQVLALVRAGDIDPSQAQGEIVRRLEEQVALFPELREQFTTYMNLLTSADGTVITTKVVTIYEEQGRDAADRSDQARQRDAAHGDGRDAASAVADGISSGLDGIANAGREAGRTAAEAAADEIETTLRRSGSGGLNLGGFLVEGINLGTRQAEIDLRNFFNGMTAGLSGVVSDAMRIDNAEASEILSAVAAMDQATRDLAEAREKLGADSIEAKIAEMELAEAQQNVNDVLAEAIDSTEAYQEALDRVTDSIDTMTGSLRALQGVRDAQKAAEEAAKGASDAAARVGMFDRLIVETEARLRDARRAGDTLTAGRLEDSLTDLRNRRGEAAEAATDAEYGLRDAQLDLVDTQQRLVELGGQVGEAQGVWEGYFRGLATQAGLSKEAVDALVDSLTVAGSAAQAIRTGVLTGSPQAVNFGAFAPPTAPAVGSVTGANASVKTYNFNIYETTSARGTAVAIVDEQRAVELMG